MDTDLLPVAYQRLLDELASEPGPARAMWYYVLVLMMIEDNEAHIVETNHDGDLVHLVVRDTSGEMFDVVRPPMSQELVDSLLGQAREHV